MPQLFTPQVLTEAERTLLEAEYQKVFLDPVERDNLWSALHQYFLPLGATEDFSFSHDYFRWYTDLTWKSIHRLKPDEFVSIALFRQIYKAIQLGFDITQSIIYHLDFNCFEEADMQKLFERIRGAFVNSPAIVGLEKGMAVSVSEFVKRLEKIKPLDALQKAETYTQWSPILSVPTAYKDYYTVNTSDALIDHIDGIATFFAGVQTKNIYYIVQAAIHPGLFDKELKPVSEEISEEGEINDASNSEPISLDDIDLEAEQIIGFGNIIEMVDEKFQKDETGQYTDIEGVFAFLEELAAKYEDERISKLLYFDEKTGGFTWLEESELEQLS